MEEFTKYDIDKLMFSLVDPTFIEGIAEVLTIGATKYSPNNWKMIQQGETYRYKDALLRHINQYMKGDILDDDTHKSHLLHAACNLMFLHYFDRITK